MVRPIDFACTHLSEEELADELAMRERQEREEAEERRRRLRERLSFRFTGGML